MTDAPKMTCRELIEFLDDYIDERIELGVRATFEAHVRVCPPCRDYIDTYRQTVRMSQSMCESPDDPLPEAAPEELIQAILAARKRP